MTEGYMQGRGLPQTQYASQTEKQGKVDTEYRPFTTVRRRPGARREPSAGCRRTEETGREAGMVSLWFREGQHRQSPHSKGYHDTKRRLIAQDKLYKVGSLLCDPAFAGHPEDIVYHTSIVESQ